MPPILIGFFILVGSMITPPFVRGVITPKDLAMRSRYGDPVPQGYRTWLSRSDPALAGADGACDVTLFAMANRGRVVRARLDGVEQGLDSGFSRAYLVPAGTRQAFVAEYLDPVGGAVLACQEVSVACYGKVYGELDTVQSPTGPCHETRDPSSESQGKPRLVGSAPALRLYDASIGGAAVDVEFVIRGKVTEDYYCPRLEVSWPDGTNTVRESDCVPFAEVAGVVPVQRWSFGRTFPPGEWEVKGCLVKSGKLVACTVVTVRVVGG